MKPKVAVILPVSDSMPHLEIMIKALYGSTKFPFKLIIIESESTDGTYEFVDNLQTKYDNIEVHHVPKEGLVKAINYGISQTELDVYLTQDDVIHFPLYGRDWLLEMHNLSKKKDMGIVTSLGGYGISDSSYVDGMKWAGTWNTYIPRKTIKKIGLLDENMGPGDDIEYSYRIGLNGLKGGIINYWIQHHRLTEHGDVDSKKKQKKMSEYFKKKYGIR